MSIRRSRALPGLRELMNKATHEQNVLANGPNYQSYSGPGAEDDLGIGVQQRGAEARQQHIQDERERNPYGTMISGYGTIGPLPDRRWEGFFQALDEKGVSKLRGGPSAPGSNQITGQSLQPSYTGLGSRSTAGDYGTVLRRNMQLAQEALRRAVPGPFDTGR